MYSREKVHVVESYCSRRGGRQCDDPVAIDACSKDGQKYARLAFVSSDVGLHIPSYGLFWTCLLGLEKAYVRLTITAVVLWGLSHGQVLLR